MSSATPKGTYIRTLSVARATTWWGRLCIFILADLQGTCTAKSNNTYLSHLPPLTHTSVVCNLLKARGNEYVQLIFGL